MKHLKFMITLVTCMTVGHVITRLVLKPGSLYLIVAPAIGFFVYVVVTFIYHRIRLGEAGMQKLIDDGNRRVKELERENAGK